MTGSGRLRGGWWRTAGHLSEDRLLALALDTTRASASSRRADQHLHSCRECADRYQLLAAQIGAIPATLSAGFDDVFTPSRLATQRTRISHRMAQLVGNAKPARVLAFPFSGRPLPRLAWAPGRWISVAVAAGLLLGVTTGQFLHVYLAEPEQVVGAAVETEPPATAVSLDMTGTDDSPPLTGNPTGAAPLSLYEFEQVMPEVEFLGIVDLALAQVQVSELQSIDALTPRVSNLAANIR